MKKAIIIPCLLAGLFFTACHKSSTTPDNTDQDVRALQLSVSGDDQGEAVYNDVFTNVAGVNAEVGLGTGIGIFLKPTGGSNNPNNGVPTDGTAGAPPSCVSVSVDPVTPGVFPKTVTIDFGSGCQTADGNTRRGKLIAVYTGPLRTAGSKVTVTFEDFYFNSLKVGGTVVAENKSTANGQVFTITVTNGSVADNAGNGLLVNRSHTWTQTEGNGTVTPADDVYNVTGSSTGTASNGTSTVQWTTNITKPVVRKLSCRWRVSGQVTITRNDKTAVLDYGNGDCDNAATVTFNGKVYNVTLH